MKHFTPDDFLEVLQHEYSKNQLKERITIRPNYIRIACFEGNIYGEVYNISSFSISKEELIELLNNSWNTQIIENLIEDYPAIAHAAYQKCRGKKIQKLKNKCGFNND